MTLMLLGGRERVVESAEWVFSSEVDGFALGSVVSDHNDYYKNKIKTIDQWMNLMYEKIQN